MAAEVHFWLPFVSVELLSEREVLCLISVSLLLFFFSLAEDLVTLSRWEIILAFFGCCPFLLWLLYLSGASARTCFALPSYVGF